MCLSKPSQASSIRSQTESSLGHPIVSKRTRSNRDFEPILGTHGVQSDDTAGRYTRFPRSMMNRPARWQRKSHGEAKPGAHESRIAYAQVRKIFTLSLLCNEDRRNQGCRSFEKSLVGESRQGKGSQEVKNASRKKKKSRKSAGH